MDFNLTDEQELIVASYRDYMESENWETYFHECDEAHEYPLRAQGLCEIGSTASCSMRSTVASASSSPITTLMAIYEVLRPCRCPDLRSPDAHSFTTPSTAEGTQGQIDACLKYLGTGEQVVNSGLAPSRVPALTFPAS